MRNRKRRLAKREMEPKEHRERFFLLFHARVRETSGWIPYPLIPPVHKMRIHNYVWPDKYPANVI